MCNHWRDTCINDILKDHLAAILRPLAYEGKGESRENSWKDIETRYKVMLIGTTVSVRGNDEGS